MKKLTKSAIIFVAMATLLFGSSACTVKVNTNPNPSNVPASSVVSEVSTASVEESSAEESSEDESSVDESSVEESSEDESSVDESSVEESDVSSTTKFAKNMKEYMEIDGVKDAIEKSMASSLGDDKGSAKVSVKGTNTVFIEYTYSDDYTEEQIAAKSRLQP